MRSGVVYEIYIDVLYGNCLVMNYLILTLTGIFLKRSATRTRRFLVSVLCAAISCVCLLSGMPDAIRSILGYGVCEILALTLTFQVKSGNGLLEGVVCMYLLTFLYGGCLSFVRDRFIYIKEHGYTSVMLVAAGCVCFELMMAMYKRIVRNREEQKCLYRVRFVWKGIGYSCIGLYDTGNQLYEPIRKLPVCIVDQDVMPEWEQTDVEAVVPFHSLGCRHGLLYGVFADNFQIIPFEEVAQEVHTQNHVLIGIYRGHLSSQGAYQMILHPELLSFMTERKIHSGKEVL